MAHTTCSFFNNAIRAFYDVYVFIFSIDLGKYWKQMLTKGVNIEFIVTMKRSDVETSGFIHVIDVVKGIFNIGN